MRPQELKESIKHLARIRRPGFIWGPPGGGKSAIMAQAAREIDYQLIDLRAVLMDPVDFLGIPTIKDGRTHWNPPDIFPTDPESKGILFLDEFNAAPPQTQAVGYQLIFDNKIGTLELPPGWVCMAAGNRDTDRAITHRMSSALSSRFVHIELESNLDDWVLWSLQAGIQTEIISFLRFRPDLLHNFDPAFKSFPCPRTWEFMSRMLGAGISPGVEYELFKGTIGEAAAAEFLGYLKIFRSLPSMDQILLNPAAAPVPKDPAALYAVSTALATKASAANIERITAYSYRLPPEFSVLLIRDSAKRAPDVMQTRAFIEWATKNKDVLI
ncbi:MAG: AAA family ATPase [Bacteroidetes bacterium]|nr:AAA family ATPase [Bacteroidota bacterium]